MTSLIHGICKEMIQMILLKSRKILIASENKFMVAGRKDGKKGRKMMSLGRGQNEKQRH